MHMRLFHLILITGALSLSAPLSAQPQQTPAIEIEGVQTDRENNGVGHTLEDFFLSALEYSPRLQIAKDRWEAGKARKRQSTGQLLPQLSATANITENRQREQSLNRLREYRGERYALQLRQLLFDWAAFKERSATASMEDQAEAEYYGELGRVLTDLAERYFNTLQAEDELRSIESELDAIRTQLRQFERMHQLQMIQITDLYEVQARVAEVEAQQILLSSEVAIARDALRSASGLSVGELHRLNKNSSVPRIEGDLEQWVDTARKSNFDIRARQFAVDVADARVSQQRGQYLPRVSLIAQGQQSNLGFDNTLLSSRTDTNYIGIDVTVPLFAGGSNRARVGEAISLRSVASNELRQTNLEIGEQTRLTFLQLQALERRLEASEKVVEARAIAEEARQRGFELGTVTSVDVLSAVRDRFAAERDLQNQRYEYLKLSLYLRQYAGSLTADDLLAVSATLSEVQPED